MNVKQEQSFQPVVITLETIEEVSRLYANLTTSTSDLSAENRDFAYRLSELINKNTNTFSRIEGEKRS